MENEKKITGKEVSFWLDTTPVTNFPKLDKKLRVDVAILGEALQV
jgi:hypothetical protein